MILGRVSGHNYLKAVNNLMQTIHSRDKAETQIKLK